MDVGNVDIAAIDAKGKGKGQHLDKGKGKGKGKNDKGKGKGKGKGQDNRDKCFQCGKPGHTKKECWHNPANKGERRTEEKGAGKGRDGK